MLESQPHPQEPKKSSFEILYEQVSEEVAQFRRSNSGLFISGLTAGLEAGFSVLLMATMLTLTNDSLPAPIVGILVAMSYSVGFIIIVLGRSELFTEHTALAFLPLLDGQVSLRDVGRLWGLVYTANLIGGALFALLATTVGRGLGITEAAAFGEIGRSMVEHPWWAILLSGMLAAWLMGLLSWLVTASRDTISQIVIVAIITTTIGLAHLHHVVVGSIEVLAALFASEGVTLADYGHFLLWTTLGNAIGGPVFVALFKYGHATRNPREVKEAAHAANPKLVPVED